MANKTAWKLENGTLTVLSDEAWETMGWNADEVLSVTVADGVTEIGAAAFKDCALLTAVTLPASVEKIGAFAFAKCTALRSVTVPQECEIDPDAFLECPAEILSPSRA